MTAVAANAKTWHCGTLTYAKLGLASLFAWLLWGDFCFTLMEAVVPNILPLKLQNLGAPNWLIGTIMATLPGVLNITVCPWVSFKSDRYRSRWGRRLPFIICTLPFLCASLAMLGFSDEIGAFLQSRFASLREMAPATATIGAVAVLMLLFQFFNMFVGSVFWYLFNDVVPAQFLGRFMGLFKIVGTGAGAVYNFFIFKYAESHMREIFVGAAVLYLVGIGLMCVFVKEGEYPPLEGEEDKDNKGWGGIRTFLRESFSHKFYWMRFLSNAFSACALAMLASFGIFFYREMGLDLDSVGKLSAVGAIAVMAAMYFMAIFVDRWQPLRICAYGAVFGVIGYAMNLVWLFASLPGAYFFWLNTGNVVIASFLIALVETASPPCQMRIFPQSRYGQFCSAQALVRSIFTMGAGILAGAFIDFFKWIFDGSSFAYRFVYLWMTVCMAFSAFFMILLYIQWNRLGGDKSFHPPAPWSPKGFEPIAPVRVIGPQSKLLKMSFLLYDGIMWMPLLAIPLLMLSMHAHGLHFAFKWHGLAVLPLSLLALFVWLCLRKSLASDIAAAKRGEAPDDGILHHGVLLVIGGQFLFVFGIWLCQEFSAVHLKLEGSSVAFGVANALVDFMLLGGLQLMRKVEKGFSVNVDKAPDGVDEPLPQETASSNV